jgi:GTP cyclohydrolase IA
MPSSMTEANTNMTNQRDSMEAIITDLLTEIGEDPSREGLIKTPERVSRAWRFLTRGYSQDIKDVLNDAVFEEDVDEMVVVRDIDFFSLCEHHLLPFYGRAHVGYIPNGKVVGLSKMPRLVEVFSRRLQLQERMTLQIARSIEETIQPKGVAVVTEAYHMCMMMRGVEKVNTTTVASAMLGRFRSDRRTRSEFMNLIGNPMHR